MSESSDVRQIATEIVAREGGYVNDPDDPGGATKYGVTIHTLRRLGLDLTEDGNISADDVRRLSQDQAIEIFLTHYFDEPRIRALPAPLHATVFDMYVNAGQAAVVLLQKLLVKMGEAITVDGVIGPQTTGACARAYENARFHLVDAYGIERRNYYFSLADRRPALRKYARRRDGGKGGWIKRAEEFISAQYHLNTVDFQARVASWG
jgi:lysozyme family protein